GGGIWGCRAAASGARPERRAGERPSALAVGAVARGDAVLPPLVSPGLTFRATAAYNLLGPRPRCQAGTRPFGERVPPRPGEGGPHAAGQVRIPPSNDARRGRRLNRPAGRR